MQRCVASVRRLLPGFETVHFISTGARRRECPGAVSFVLIGRGRYDRRRLPSLGFAPTPAAAPSHGQLLEGAVGGGAVQGLVRLAVGHVSVATVIVVRGGVYAAVVGPPLVENVGVGRIAEADSAPSLSSGAPVEPALVAVATGRVAGQSVAAGVTGVLYLPLQRTQDDSSQTDKWTDGQSDRQTDRRTVSQSNRQTDRQKVAGHYVIGAELTFECLFGESLPGTSCLSLRCPPPPPGPRDADAGTCQRGSRQTHRHPLD